MPRGPASSLLALCLLAAALPALDARRAAGALLARARAPPTYPVLSCGAVLRDNITFIEGDDNDYYAVVNATSFTVVARDLGVDSSSPACDTSVTIDFAPNGEGSFPVTEHDFEDGDTFNMTVGPSSPQRPTWDLWFDADEICDYTITLHYLEIVC